MTEARDDYDSAATLPSLWKEALERYFHAFMALGFPEAYAGIDWARGYEFLDKELQQVVRDAELGRRLADKLVKVWRVDGEEAWVLIHLEVQGPVETGFAKRIFTYHYRLIDRYDRPIVSLAVLGDKTPRWRPHKYRQALWGCEVQLTFPVLKLLDYAGQEAWLEQHPNPFAVIILAHLQAKATRHDPEARYAWKWRLVRSLYERGYKRQDILELFRLRRLNFFTLVMRNVNFLKSKHHFLFVSLCLGGNQCFFQESQMLQGGKLIRSFPNSL
jgi:hypothetical protein